MALSPDSRVQTRAPIVHCNNHIPTRDRETASYEEGSGATEAAARDLSP